MKTVIVAQVGTKYGWWELIMTFRSNRKSYESWKDNG